MTAYNTILYEQDGPIVTVTLNRPQKANSLNSELMKELAQAFDRIAADDSVRVVILTGAGKGFSAGFDISPTNQSITSIQQWREHLTVGGTHVQLRLWNLEKPVIAAVRGYAIGGGLDLTLLSDFTIASENAIFSAPEIRHISAPTFVLPFMIGMKKAKEFLLTGNRLTAQEAERIGIVTKVVPDDKLEEEVLALARELAAIPPLSLALNKAAINKAYEIMGMKSAVDYGVEILTMLLNSPEANVFRDKVRAVGLNAALAERDQIEKQK
jgi:enoyl-CoA hydratase/carnithine racemase